MIEPDKVDPHCRAEKPRRVVTEMFAVCLTEVAACPHRIDMDAQRLCFHPLRNEIVAQPDVMWYKKTSLQNPDRPADAAG